MIRVATLDDVDPLFDIENRCFDTDRLTRRSFRYLLTKGNAVTLVDDEKGAIGGYAMLLFNVGTSLARLYSFAIDPEHRGKGRAKALLEECERVALEHECVTLRLEVRRDNTPAIALWKSSGFKQFGVLEDYYEDHMQALRFEKALAPHLNPALVRVPFYQQTLDFTCGPAALMMAMKALRPELALDRALEIRIWRESTTVFMTSGHGGCGPYGLALAAVHRGFDVELYVNDQGALFVDSVRSPEKKEVIRVVEQDMRKELESLPVRLQYGAMSLPQVEERFQQGGIPIVLISSYRIYHEKFPHWVVVTGFDGKYIYVHDPYVDVDSGKSDIDCVNMPIAHKDFERMARYGKAGQKAALILTNRKQAATAALPRQMKK